MSIEPVKTEVRTLLAQVSEKLSRAEHMLEEGSNAARLRAASRLVLLRRRKEAFEMRVAELDTCPEGAVNSVVQRLKEEWFLLMQDIEAWIAGD
jgi:hypothetical protein